MGGVLNVEKTRLDPPDSVGSSSDLALRWSTEHPINGIRAQLSVRCRSQAPKPRCGAAQTPGLRSATHRGTMEPAVCGPFHLTRPTDRVSICTVEGSLAETIWAAVMTPHRKAGHMIALVPGTNSAAQSALEPNGPSTHASWSGSVWIARIQGCRAVLRRR